MRLSRSNFSGSGNSNGNGEDGHDQPAPDVRSNAQPASVHAPRFDVDHRHSSELDAPGGEQDAPLWQKAFTLRPNVRFTRTPDSAITKREEQMAEKSVAAEGPAAPRQPSPAQTLSTSSASSVTASVPQPGFAPSGHGARALVNDLRRQLGASTNGTRHPGPDQDRSQGQHPRLSPTLPTASTPESRPENPNQTVRSTAPAAAGMAAARPTHAMPTQARADARPSLGYIPDHLLWEMISLGGGDGARADMSPARPPVQAAPPTPRSFAIKAETQPLQASWAAAAMAAGPTRPREADQPLALSLYRTIEPRRAGSAAPITQPVATMPVPVPVAASEAQAIAMPAMPSAPSRAEGTALSRRFSTAVSVVDDYEFPSLDLLQAPGERQTDTMSPEALEQSAGLLESILEDFGVKGEIIDVRPGPVVTLYEFEPAPGVKSSRVIGIADDIARSMSALSARVAVIPGRNVIGIELPNQTRETVYLRELIESGSYAGTGFRLPLCLGKTIGGEPVIAELAKMPHLLVAGTTGSGKSVAINTMILSLIYRLRPEECRLIMVDPKMLELSVYDGIPHLLTPVVTDPKKAVLALKWAVREMEERYKKMSRLGVRNIDGYNSRVAVARAEGETIKLSVQTGFDRQTGETIFEEQEMDLTALPYIVVIVDEMADLMMVAGKEIEGAIQRLAQMARAAGIHLIMATQRPSVDVITGTIKANFPTRISFQVTSKIDSRTILGEQGAEHLLGQGDMLNMVGGGRIQRVHGPFVSDQEVERIVDHLKTQGRPAYLGSVTEDTEEPEAEEEDGAVFDKTAMGEEDGDDLYDRAVKIVMRDRKCSTSYIQRRLSIGYNRAASLVERMEQEGLVGAANHVGKREIIDGRPADQNGDRED